jgi:hypothetical protein
VATGTPAVAFGVGANGRSWVRRGVLVALSKREKMGAAAMGQRPFKWAQQGPEEGGGGGGGPGATAGGSERPAGRGMWRVVVQDRGGRGANGWARGMVSGFKLAQTE